MVTLCKDCVYCRTKRDGDPNDPFLYLCEEPSNVNLVTGTMLDVSCFDMRDDKIGGRCGRNASLFKAAPGVRTVVEPESGRIYTYPTEPSSGRVVLRGMTEGRTRDEFLP